MELIKFIENFRCLFDDTDPCLINEDTDYKDLEEWSSLVAMGLIAMVDEEYGVDIKGDDIRAALSVKDLFDIVKSKM